VPDEDLAGTGRETEPHLTVKYGVNEDESGLRSVLAEHQPFDATLGKLKVVPPSANSDNAAPVVVSETPDLRLPDEILRCAKGIGSVWHSVSHT